MKVKESKDKKKKKGVVGFQVLEDECIWMKAGVVNFRICDNVYDCYSCPFDLGMRKAMAARRDERKEQKSTWMEKLQKDYHRKSRQCRHTLSGRLDAPKTCSLNYECYHCAFDQALDDMQLGQLTEVANYKIVSGYQMADGYYYHMGHNWARFEHGGRVRVGMDDFIGKVLGPSQSFDLPPLGAVLTQGRVGWALERKNHKASVLSPVTGTVIAVNQKAHEHPEISHEDPYQEGWLFMVEPDAPKKNLKGLYFGEESSNWIDREAQKLVDLMGPEYQGLAATGAEPIDDVFGRLPEIGWEKLVQTFLRTEKIRD